MPAVSFGNQRNNRFNRLLMPKSYFIVGNLFEKLFKMYFLKGEMVEILFVLVEDRQHSLLASRVLQSHYILGIIFLFFWVFHIAGRSTKPIVNFLKVHRPLGQVLNANIYIFRQLRISWKLFILTESLLCTCLVKLDML